MRRLGAVAPFLLLVALLAACGSDSKPAVTATLFPADPWTIEYTSSGGIAGITQRVFLDSKGNLETEDTARKRSRKGYLVPADVSMVRAGMKAADLPNLKSDQGLPHPDSFVTSIKVVSGDKTYGATFNATPASREVSDLLRRLARIYEENRP